MPPDLHPDLHTKECNVLIEAMHKCHAERNVMKYLGGCSKEYYAVQECMNQERNAQLAKAGERHRKQTEKRQAKKTPETQNTFIAKQES